jgi:hypothetical protein
MINEIKTLLTNTGAFVSVQLAQDLDVIDDFSNTPAAIIYQGDTTFGDNVTDNFVVQAANKQIAVLLVCAASSVETLENTILAALIGYQYTSAYGGLEAIKAENYKITGHYYARKITFVTRTHIRQA